MAKAYRYCWLKMVEITPENPVRLDTNCAGLGAWAISGGGLSIHAALPHGQATLNQISPAPVPLLRDQLIIYSGCKPCPAVAPADRFRAAMQSAGEPKIASDVPSTGWQIEGAPIEDAIGGATGEPRVFFAIHPIEGDRDAAITWLASDDGKKWLKDSSTCVLLSTFEVTAP